MIFDHPREGDLPRDGDHHRYDHPRDRLEDFDHSGEGNLPKNGDQRRDGDPPRGGGHLQDFYHPKGLLLNSWSIETQWLREFTLRYV